MREADVAEYRVGVGYAPSVRDRLLTLLWPFIPVRLCRAPTPNWVMAIWGAAWYCEEWDSWPEKIERLRTEEPGE